MDFVYAINVKNKPCFVMLDGMPMVSVIFHAKENLESKPMPTQNVCTKHW
jgi:hypothetical protein